MLSSINQYMTSLLITIFVLLVPAMSWADNNPSEPLDVKVIIFTHVSHQALNSQTWPNILKKPQQLGHPLNFLSSSKANYQILSTNTSVFNNLKRRIKENGYRVIMMQHWQQPNHKRGQWIHLFGGHPYDNQGQIQYQLNSDSDYQQAPYWQIDGYLRINHYRFYQTNAHFYMTTHDNHLGINANSAGITPLKSYELNQKHATHLGKWLYFDHPLFGILVKISKK